MWSACCFTSAQLPALEADWRRLSAARGSPMLGFCWASACAEAFAQEGPVRIFAVKRNGRIAALAPLVKRKAMLARLEILGLSRIFEPTDFLYEDEASLAALCEALVAEGMPIALERLHAGSPTLDAVAHAFRQRGWVRVVPADPSPAIALDASWCEPDRHFNAGRRSDFRRAMRHAESMGPVRCEVLSPSPAEVDRLLDVAFRVEAAGWKGARGSALACDETRGRFFRALARRASGEGILRLAFLHIGDEAAAMQLAAECGGGYWLFKIGYDERFAHCSPGNLLMLHAVRHAASAGLRSFELLGAVEPWTTIWTRTERACFGVRAYPWTALGFGALAHDALRSIRRRLPALVPEAA